MTGDSQLSISREDIHSRIKEAKEALGGSTLEELKGGVYRFMDAASRTYLAAKGGAKKGWAKNITDATGSPLWDVTQANIIENIFPSIALVGGADEDPQPVTFANTSTAKAAEASTAKAAEASTAKAAKYQTTPIVQPAQPLDPQSVSLDRAYESAKQYLKTLDERNKALSQELGPIALIKDKKNDYMIGPVPPYLPIGIPVSPRLVLPILNTFLESLRLMATFGPLESDFLRMLFSVATAVLEVARGEWRNGVLSALGVFGPWYVYAGTVGKIFRLVYGFIAPDLQDALEDNFFQAGKSLLVGPWLWLFSLTAPAFIREQMAKLTDTVRTQVENFNGVLGELEQAAQAQAAPLGLRVDFKRFDPALVPSFDDIQQLQRLLRAPEIQCLDATQAALAPLANQAAFRVILELLGVTVDKALLEKKCVGRSRTLKNVLQDTAMPSITKAETGTVSMVGGRRTRRKRSKRS